MHAQQTQPEETKALEKSNSHNNKKKTHCNTHDGGKRWETYVAFKDLALFWQIGALFLAAVEICELKVQK